MEYKGNINLLLIGVVLGGLLVMVGLIYFAYWLLIKKAKHKKDETE